jgi:hypothetical protein
VEAELAAAAAAGLVVPVPAVLARVDLRSGVAAVLLRRLPGQPAGQSAGVDRRRAVARGRACGQAQLAINAVPAPLGVPPAVGLDRGDWLLHLDLHPLNLLVDDDDQVSGVLDWANTAGGPAAFDRARTHTILRLDPRARELGRDPSWAALVTGWSEPRICRTCPRPRWPGPAVTCSTTSPTATTPDQLAHARTALRPAESAYDVAIDLPTAAVLRCDTRW